MLLSKKPCILALTIIIVTSSIIPIFSAPTLNAQSINETTTFYFIDYLDIEGGSNYDSIGFVPTMSLEPPTSTNNSYYPPRVADFPANQDELILWLSYWTLSFLDLSEIIGENDLLFPNPLRIIEAYDNTGSESLFVNGNVEFNLDFNSDVVAKLSSKDQVKVSVYRIKGFQSTILGSTTSQIASTLFSSVNSQTISVPNIDAEIKTGESIAFAIEIIPSNSTITKLLTNENSIFSTFTQTITEFVLDSLGSISNPELQDLLDVYNEIQNISDEFNFTKSDIVELVDAVISPSLVYASVNHQGSVTVPFTGSSDDENSIRYYLIENNALSTEKPTGDSSSVVLLGQSVKWDTPGLSRSKILTSASANVYIRHTDYVPLTANMDVQASLLQENTVLSSYNFSLEKTSAFESMTKSYQIPFSLSQQGTEIAYDESLSLKIEISGNIGSIGPVTYRTADLLFDGANEASSLSLTFSETDHITSSTSVTPANGKIIAGDSVIHTLTISSRFQDEVTIQKKTVENEEGYWDITIQPSELSMNANDEKTVQVTCRSTNYALDSYDQDPLSIEVEIFGKTGYSTETLVSEVSEEAVTYSTLISPPDIDELKKGRNHTFSFDITNNNTGLWPNSFIYTASSDNNYSIFVSPFTFDDLGVGNSTIVNITISIPKNTEVKSDTLTFSVKSKESGLWTNTTITYDIVSETEIADFFRFFEDMAQDLGLEESFGDFAPFVIPILLLILVFIVLILIVFLFTSHPFSIRCNNPKIDILPYENAEYFIEVRNRLSKKQVIDIEVKLKGNKDKWRCSTVDSPLILLAKETKRLKVHVQPTSLIDQDDLGVIEVVFTSSLSKKPSQITLETRISDGESDVSIDNVNHWPHIFRAQDRVSTSFKLHNNGSVQTKQVDVKLYLNGKEKNKVEDIIIPARGYAEIRIPWIAEKGKNNISLVVI